MIYFVCAMPAEAAPFIRTFDLEKRRMPYRYEVYVSRADAEYPVCLTVSGIGAFHAACAASFLFGLYPPGPDDLLVNAGLCGASPALTKAEQGTVFQCGKILSPDGRDCVYPAVRRDVPWPVATLKTSDHVVTLDEQTQASGYLYDMEGCAFAKTALGFTGPDRVAVIKVVYDRLSDIKHPGAEDIFYMLWPVAEEFYRWGKQTRRADEDRRMQTTEALKERARRIASEAHVTVSMHDRILSRIRYVSALLEAYRLAVGHETSFTDPKEAFDEAERAIEAGHFLKPQQNRFLSRLDRVAESIYENGELREAAKRKEEPFSVLYVEEAVADHPRTQNILHFFPEADVIYIDRYRDVFNRSRQEMPGRLHEGAARALVVARQNDIHIYPGAPMCQDHGHRKFYYASFVMNCLYDCEYCYLQGMYPSKMPVIFVNPEDILSKIADIEKTLKDGETAYVSVSFDTDLCAMDGLTGFTELIVKFAKEHPQIEIEIRTKSAGTAFTGQGPAAENLRIAWTFSPEAFIDRVEHKTASLKARLDGMMRTIREGYRLRICLDPLLYLPNAKTEYEKLVDHVMEAAAEAAQDVGKTLSECVEDVSVGPFRIGSDQLANMRRIRPDSFLVMYPYEIESRTARYPKEIEEQLMTAVKERLKRYVPEEKIFCWDTMRQDSKQERRG